jgi:ribosome biogenesis protein ERB1
MGWIKPHQLHPAKPSDRDDDDHENLATYDLWAENEQTSSKSSLDRLRMHIPAPKLPLPTHVESYNPPAEFLFTDDERRQWEETEAEERAQNFVPAKFDCLRHVPGYTRLVNERYERCMDLYLAPRQRKMKV